MLVDSWRLLLAPCRRQLNTDHCANPRPTAGQYSAAVDTPLRIKSRRILRGSGALIAAVACALQT